jgi:hypothetical protein
MTPEQAPDEKCQHCRFWRATEGRQDGWCRRFPPTPFNTILATGVYQNFPFTREFDWCGEFQRS